MFRSLLFVAIILFVTNDFSTATPSSVLDWYSNFLMNTRADPCQDFYEYSCGRYFKIKYPSSFSGSHNLLLGEYDSIRTHAENWLKSNITRGGGYEEKMKKMYKSCMDRTKKVIKDRSILKNFDDCNSHDWPTMNSKWQESSYNLQQLVDSYYYEGHFKTSALFRFFLDMDTGVTPQVYYLKIIQPIFFNGISRVSKRNDMAVLAFEKQYSDMAEALGADNVTAKADAGPVTDFILELFKIMLPLNQLYNVTMVNNPMTLGEMNGKYPYINWYKMVRDIYNEMNIKILPSQRVNVHTPTFFSDLDGVLKKTSKRTVANYLAFMRSKEKFGSTQYCVKNVLKLYNAGMAKVLADTLFTAQDTSNMDEMMRNIKDAFIKTINENTAFDDYTKGTAIKKIKAMKTKTAIRALDTYTNSELDHLYSHFIVSGDFVADRIQNEEERKKLKLRDINKQFIPQRWELSRMLVNGYYIPQSNDLGISMGSLLEPHYHSNYSGYRNYANVGCLIGHEMAHSIDSNGKEYDERGRVRNWWTPKSQKAMDVKTQCFIHQYGNFTDKQVNLTLRGTQSLVENIPDSIALSQAFIAYQTYTTKHGFEESNNQLNLTNDQLFFLSFAQARCTKYKDDTLKDVILTKIHSPDRYRIIGPLQNSEAFSKAFGCQVGDYMNPKDKCIIW